MANNQTTTRDRVAKHVVVTPLLKKMHEELKEFAKKKPEASLSQTKIKMVNRLLEKCQVVLADEPELEFLDLLDGEGTIAQASDAVLMIGQFVSALDSFFDRYCHRLAGVDWDYSSYWHVENGDHLSREGAELGVDDDEEDAESEQDEDEDEDED